ncbi:unnamed protein product (macronuclear) [Paramecium tetraurelia]|uniref:Transmembrane protein n=1 Tax=Paramecium tetraurelia TaxID=5888 RepID=A0BWX8_PARTE|nr:uncharacterized protein GSPATT00032897001 [Paramecium tetraurelia]CAK63045.1 unnamed protein product [Paramecium tetraurelia]|eukprot:XP_001430443.1 hypothetical protein (macronuclear) [Paramecium tetraurelia strain d4-2]
MKRGSFGHINTNNSQNNQAFEAQTQETQKGSSKFKKFMTDDFSHFQKRKIIIETESNQSDFKSQVLKEMGQQKNLKSLETPPNSIINRLEQQQCVPFYIKQREDQLKQVKQYKSHVQHQIYQDDDVNKKVCIFLIEAFSVIFIILITAHLFLNKYLQ